MLFFVFAFVLSFFDLVFGLCVISTKLECLMGIIIVISVAVIACGFIVAGILERHFQVNKKIAALKFCIWEKCDEAQVKDASSSSKCKFIFDSISEHPETLKEIYKAYAQAIENL